MIRVTSELEAQLEQWSNHIPNFRSAEGSRDISDELEFMLHGRVISFRVLLYRPFLFRAIHSSVQDTTRQAAVPLAQQCLEGCVAGLKRASLHRHHGAWYVARQSFAWAALLLAAAKSGTLILPEGWREALALADAHLGYWEDESPDLKVARELLCQMQDDVLGATENTNGPSHV